MELKMNVLNLLKIKLKNIYIKGFVNQNNLKFYYEVSDVMIQTSNYETGLDHK